MASRLSWLEATNMRRIAAMHVSGEEAAGGSQPPTRHEADFLLTNEWNG
ncbi:MAG TPA: hypothetical protein VGQ96_04040 [Candidatus Eremiobacteraceae bacterium]|nr:hypothetical protein [Candidatus Eremiobacteraceae bacterium]